jgi:hypothetical protein
MLKIQRTYCNRFDDVHSYFITYRKTQSNNVEIEHDIIYIKGEETYLGITRKTIDAIEYLLETLPYKVDYIVRTNMSTVINIPELKTFCNSIQNKNVYTSGNMNELQWLDESSGIIDNSLFGTKYASGTSIIMSNDIATSLIESKHNIRHDIIDDVSIGVFMNTYLPHVFNEETPQAKFITVPYKIDTTIIKNDACFYRNRSSKDRENDLKNMKILCDLLYNETESFRGINIDTNNIIQYSGWTLVLCSLGYFTYKFIFCNKQRKK